MTVDDLLDCGGLIHFDVDSGSACNWVHHYSFIVHEHKVHDALASHNLNVGNCKLLGDCIVGRGCVMDRKRTSLGCRDSHGSGVVGGHIVGSHVGD